MKFSGHATAEHCSLGAFADRLLRVMPRFMRIQAQQERNDLVRGIISIPQMWILRQVGEMGACSMHTLARSQGLKASTVTGLADRLVELGLLQRFPGESDRREVLARLTAKGRRTLVAFNTDRRKSIIRLFRHIAPRERATYLDIMENIVRFFATAQATGARPGRTPTSHRNLTVKKGAH